MARTSPHPTAEGCQSLVLTINPVMRPVADALRDARRSDAEGAVEAGARMRWTRRGEPAPWAWVDVAVQAHPPDYADAVLRYDVAHISRPTGLRVQRVAVVGAPCPYGGVQWFWICPATGRRVRNLYLPNGGTRFLSRDAYRLRWLTTCSTPLAKSHMRLARIAAKLGAEYRAFTKEPPPRPKWMRWRTYDRIVADWEAACARHDVVWADRAQARAMRRTEGADR